MALYSVLCLFLTVQWVGLRTEIVAFPGHTQLLLDIRTRVGINLGFIIKPNPAGFMRVGFWGSNLE